MISNNDDGIAFICIPDITGFTRFMAQNKIEFTRKIIPPLLRTIVTSNTLNMKIGEIEGDAVVFYRFGTLPTLKEIMDQCDAFYSNFTDQLQQLAKEFSGDYTEENSPSLLSLKIICHAAEITSTHIEGLHKLIGEDMVVVHKLLKNSVAAMEYILLSDKLLGMYPDAEKNIAVPENSRALGSDEYEFIGTINYHYITLPLIKPDAETSVTSNNKDGN